MSTDLFRMQLANLRESLPLEERIIEALNASDKPMACFQLFDVIPDCPDRETLSRTVHSMAKEGQIVPVTQVPAPPGYPRGSVAVYNLPGSEFQPREEKKPVRAEPAKHPWRTLPPRTIAPKQPLETVTEVPEEPVKEAPAPRQGRLTIKEQIGEMVRGIPESLAISKEDIIRHLPHVKRSTILSFIPLMVREGEVLAAIGNTLNRRYFDIRTKGAESVKPESASVIKPLSYEMKPPVSIDASLIETQPPVPPVPHVMRQAVIGQADLDPVFALDTNGRLRIEQGEHIILCGTATVRKLALLLNICEHVY